jgi:hypothetical protein
MNPILYLLLAHFVADYPLQPSSLVDFKKKNYLGILLHCLIHMVLLILVLLPFLHLVSVWIGIAVIFITHNIIDYFKIYFDKKYPACRLVCYLLDQTMHMIVIALVSLYLWRLDPNTSCDFYTDQTIVLYLLILVLTTFFYDITRHFIVTRKTPGHYKRDYRMMLINTFIVSVAFAMYWII